MICFCNARTLSFKESASEILREGESHFPRCKLALDVVVGGLGLIGVRKSAPQLFVNVKVGVLTSNPSLFCCFYVSSYLG